MPEFETTLPEKIVQNNAVLNPYALAELIAGRKIKWNEVSNVPKLLETILQTPYQELFDPKFEGPLYTGFKLNPNLQLEKVRSTLFDVEIRLDINDLERVADGGLADLRKLADLGPRFDQRDVGEITIQKAELVGQSYLQITLRLPDRERLERLSQILPKNVLATISYDTKLGNVQDWTPPDTTWQDGGRFFNETAEFFDPIQGNVANCYYIAALSAVAWANPKRIRHMTRATGVNNDRFNNIFQFFKPDSNGALDREVEVTDTIPLTSWGSPIYCRSSEVGEIWPALYEKAYAKLLTGSPTDHPNILATAWGDCVWATAQLTGGQRAYYDTSSRTGNTLWDIVRGNSLGGRTINPMTAWTYSSGDATGKKIVYANANIVASHCYTILGWDYRNSQRYLIVRNPWGNTEPTVGVLSGTSVMYDISWWRPINLASVDGTFGIEVEAFKTYFAGLGVVKGGIAL